MRKLLFSLAGILFLSMARAQSITPSVINSTGGSAVSGNNPSNAFYLDWNVGEMTLVNTMRTSGKKILIITNGFLQPEYSGDNGNEPERLLTGWFTNAEVRVFPNPASEYVDVNLFFEETGTVRLNLFSVMGEQLFTREFSVTSKARVEQVPVRSYTPGTYLLQVQLFSEGKLVKQGSFKIVKTD
jgi:hypothetical protein